MAQITVQPAVWLLALLAGLSQISETVYSPSLPDIARAMHVSESVTEYTLTIYLFGFALGSLFWGKLSDRIGRKPCIIAGLLIYLLGCVGCYFSQSIEMLMISRLIQAIGGGVGSVVSQAITYDSFVGHELGKVFSTVGSALAVFPAVGPVVGGFIAQGYGWAAIFLSLFIFGGALLLVVFLLLPETLHPEHHQAVPTWQVLTRMYQDKLVISYGVIIGAAFGICFSYYAEGSFYLMDLLGLTPSAYGLTFLAVAGATVLGGIISRRLHRTLTSLQILSIGLQSIVLGSMSFAMLIALSMWLDFSKPILVAITVTNMMLVMAGICIATSTSLSLALRHYRAVIGTATSLFVFSYFILISLFTLIMGFVRNDNLMIMPIYFVTISLISLVAFKYVLKKDNQI